MYFVSLVLTILVLFLDTTHVQLVLYKPVRLMAMKLRKIITKYDNYNLIVMLSL